MTNPVKHLEQTGSSSKQASILLHSHMQGNAPPNAANTLVTEFRSSALLITNPATNLSQLISSLWNIPCIKWQYFLRYLLMSSSYHKSVFQVDIFHHFSPSNDSYVFACVVSDAGGALWRELERSNHWSSKLGV